MRRSTHLAVAGAGNSIYLRARAHEPLNLSVANLESAAATDLPRPLYIGAAGDLIRWRDDVNGFVQTVNS